MKSTDHWEMRSIARLKPVVNIVFHRKTQLTGPLKGGVYRTSGVVNSRLKLALHLGHVFRSGQELLLIIQPLRR